jgi:hypothetical protein
MFLFELQQRQQSGGDFKAHWATGLGVRLMLLQLGAAGRNI